MNKREAKELSSEVWRYLRDHPSIDTKSKLPIELFTKIESMYAHCPICHLYMNCDACPLNHCLDGAYGRWENATTSEERGKAAGTLVKQIEAWEVE